MFTARCRSAPSGVRAKNAGSDRVFAALTRTDTDGFLQTVDENLSVADPSGLAGLFDGLDHRNDHVVRYDYLDLHLGHEVDHVRGATVDLFLTTCTPEALHLSHSH